MHQCPRASKMYTSLLVPPWRGLQDCDCGETRAGLPTLNPKMMQCVTILRYDNVVIKIDFSSSASPAIADLLSPNTLTSHRERRIQSRSSVQCMPRMLWQSSSQVTHQAGLHHLGRYSRVVAEEVRTVYILQSSCSYAAALDSTHN